MFNNHFLKNVIIFGCILLVGIIVLFVVDRRFGEVQIVDESLDAESAEGVLQN